MCIGCRPATTVNAQELETGAGFKFDRQQTESSVVTQIAASAEQLDENQQFFAAAKNSNSCEQSDQVW